MNGLLSILVAFVTASAAFFGAIDRAVFIPASMTLAGFLG